VVYLIQYLQQMLTWFMNFMDWLGAEIGQLLASAIVAVINVIPLPSWWTQGSLSLPNLPPMLLYIASAFDFATMLQVFFLAYTTRFLIRRIPVIN
jgi:hypothetical protein